MKIEQLESYLKNCKKSNEPFKLAALVWYAKDGEIIKPDDEEAIMHEDTKLLQVIGGMKTLKEMTVKIGFPVQILPYAMESSDPGVKTVII